ncbi:magnesium transporter MgtE N-terminal domain-containing protein [Edaphobacter sp. 12200R-103]|uniref:magnesium transporter MgtE N-terminal domain-containing protein n=1 Tax=Edaphobacter sp. 12200R-103 TaxID=2703788 RepID=UPI00138C8B06|nr:CBS domain-containing protein [Edaphobacter sp. 12200R-103]QHS50946.1 magnesium transporter [Edaphobacter sp. 12200R-103]
MNRHGNLRTTVSALVGASVVDSTGATLGRVQEFAVLPGGEDSSRVLGLILKLAKKDLEPGNTMAAVCDLEWARAGLSLRPMASLEPPPQDPVLLERDLLDQQIIDVHGRKVVRVNDVVLEWEQRPGIGTSLRILEVEVGLRGAVRRLLKGFPVGSVDRIAQRFGPSVIPWEFVDLIDPARRVRLKVDQDRLSQMHPSDIADILEELAPAERQVLFESLDEEVAAETLEEVEPRLQKSLIQSLDSEQVAGIVEEMDPGAAADLLAELPEEKSEAILEGMDPAERQEVEELLEFSQDSAAGRMTTEYIALPASATVADVHAVLRHFEGDIDLITDIYLLDEKGRVMSVVPIVQILLAQTNDMLAELPHAHLVTCQIEMGGRKVAELFDKYNLRALPVVDTEHKLVGVVHAEQVISLLRSQ